MLRIIVFFALLASIGLSLISCEDIVAFDLDSGEPILVVDAWLEHTEGEQEIILTYSQPYFENLAPQRATGATVKVVEIESNTVFNFQDPDKNGTYTYLPVDGEPFGTMDSNYGLEIILDGITYYSLSRLTPTAQIDSITFEFNEQDLAYEEDWYYGEVWARDLPGLGNTYWIKSYQNGKFLNKPSQINIAYDASFSAGNQFDNKTFIQPIRTGITPFPEDTPAKSPYKKREGWKIVKDSVRFSTSSYGYVKGDTLIFNDTEVKESPKNYTRITGQPYFLRADSLYQRGDIVRVEVHSITPEAWFFLFRVADETIRLPGFAQLFATPPADVSTNIFTDVKGMGVAGFFNISDISSMTVEVRDETIIDLVPQ